MAMANSQLVDYARQQLKKGIAKDAVLKALKDVGWPDAEITSAMSEAEGQTTAPAATTNPVTPVASAQPTVAAQPAAAMPAQFTQPIAQSASASGDMAFKINEIMMTPGTSPDKLALPKEKSKLLPAVIGLAVLSVAAVAAAGYFYFQGSGASDEITSLNERMKGLNSQMSLLSQQKQDSDAKVATLTQDKETLTAELAPFVSSAPFQSSTPELPVSIKGNLSGGDNRTFAITTPGKITFYVKNWKDKAVDAALRANLTKDVTVAGSHAPGSIDITVTEVNGTTIQFTTATSTPTSSTTAVKP
jgi:hypothetical protein